MPTAENSNGPVRAPRKIGSGVKDLLSRDINDIRVKDIMTHDPVFVEVPGSRSAALTLMAKHTFSGLPVVKKRSRELVGGITRHDIFEHPEERQLAMIMETEVQTIGPEATLKELARKIVDTGCYRVVVVNKSRVLQGIVTPADLLFLLESSHFDQPIVEYRNKPICVPIYRLTPLPVVAHIMRISRFYALPVLNEELHVIGMVTDIDLFSHTDMDEKIVKSHLGIGLDDDEWSWEGMRNIMSIYNSVSKTTLPMIPVEDVMVKDVECVYRQTTISAASNKMRKHDIAQLPIVDSDDRLFGMIRNTDVLKALQG